MDEIRSAACATAFGDPLTSNIYRGLIAEIIVGAALGPDWRMCSGDWRGWDFERSDGSRLEVKQSAVRQTWTGDRPPSKPVFDIRARSGYFEGADWIADPRRFAEVYVFAHHPIMDSTADHRDVRQWKFHVIRADQLPAAKTISLVRIVGLAAAVPWGELKASVERSLSAEGDFV